MRAVVGGRERGGRGDAVAQEGRLGVVVEIDRDVAAEYDIEPSQKGKVFHQIELPEACHAPDFVA